ncbi:MAG: hypothetical protein H0X13_19565 [Ramlibacter sp.]|nr:hypothetical protein [Ramlibacter sp.]
MQLAISSISAEGSGPPPELYSVSAACSSSSNFANRPWHSATRRAPLYSIIRIVRHVRLIQRSGRLCQWMSNTPIRKDDDDQTVRMTLPIWLTAPASAGEFAPALFEHFASVSPTPGKFAERACAYAGDCGQAVRYAGAKLVSRAPSGGASCGPRPSSGCGCGSRFTNAPRSSSAPTSPNSGLGTARITIRIPARLLDDYKAMASRSGIGYQTLIIRTLRETALPN